MYFHSKMYAQRLKGLAHASFAARLSRYSTEDIVDLLEGVCPHAC